MNVVQLLFILEGTILIEIEKRQRLIWYKVDKVIGYFDVMIKLKELRCHDSINRVS